MLRKFAHIPIFIGRDYFYKYIKYNRKEDTMNIGDKLSELRKKKGLSQEELAEQLSVTRQTISKWELNETSPNINQAKELSKLFNVSLDEMAGNGINDILSNKINKNYKILKIIMSFNIIMLILLLFIFITIFFTIAMSLDYFTVTPSGQSIEFPCFKNDNLVQFDYIINMDMNGNIKSVQGEEVVNFSKYSDGNELATAINDYYENIGGRCGTVK